MSGADDVSQPPIRTRLGGNMGALLALASGVIVNLGRRVLTRRGAALVGGGAAGALIGEVGIPGIDLFPDGAAPRRRRRRMLTVSDRHDIAFLAATLGRSNAAKALFIRI